MEYENLKKLIETIAVLRSKDGCAWDREQTHASLKRNMLEEAYEAVDAINSGDMKHLKEELGDVLLQVVLHSQIAKENNDFDIDEVAKGINEKLIRRHPHVFGGLEVDSVDEIVGNWEKIKQKEKPHRTSNMDGVSKAQSALMTAQKISNKAVKVGFEWDKVETLYECIFSEFKEFEEAEDKDKEEELGDILFAVVNLARWHKLDAEQALIKSCDKFKQRFMMMEKLASKPLEKYTFEQYEGLWKKAKEAVYGQA